MLPPSAPEPWPSWRISTPVTASAIVASLREVGWSPMRSMAPAAVTAGVVLITTAPTTPEIIPMP
jgi:hypothetical protein